MTKKTMDFSLITENSLRLSILEEGDITAGLPPGAKEKFKEMKKKVEKELKRTIRMDISTGDVEE